MVSRRFGLARRWTKRRRQRVSNFVSNVSQIYPKNKIQRVQFAIRCEEILSPPQKEQPPADRVLRRREQAPTPSSKDVNSTPSPASALLPPSNPPPRPLVQEQITTPCHPSQAMQSQQTVFRVDPPPVAFLRLAPAHLDVPSTPQTLQVPASGSQFITFTRAPSKSPLPPPGPHVMPGITGRFNSRAEPPRPTLSRVGPPELPAPIPPWDSRARPAPANDSFLSYTQPCDFGQQRGAARQPLQQRFMVSEELGAQNGRSSSSLGSRIAQLRPAAFSPERSPTSDGSQDSEDIVSLSPGKFSILATCIICTVPDSLQIVLVHHCHHSITDLQFLTWSAMRISLLRKWSPPTYSLPRQADQMALHDQQTPKTPPLFPSPKISLQKFDIWPTVKGTRSPSFWLCSVNHPCCPLRCRRTSASPSWGFSGFFPWW